MQKLHSKTRKETARDTTQKRAKTAAPLSASTTPKHAASHFKTVLPLSFLLHFKGPTVPQTNHS